MDTLMLSRREIESYFTMNMCMEAVEEAFAGLARGHADMPQRTPIALPEKSGLALFMPAHIRSLEAIGAKVVTVYPENPRKHHLPCILGTILLLDEETGFPVAVMDGGFITAMRTGAASGVATRFMARPDACTATVFGTGVQAFTQVLAVHEARPLRLLRAISIDPIEARQEFGRKVTEKTGIPVEIAAKPEAAVRESDLVILATTAAVPIIDGSWLRPGTHINGVGSHTPKTREIDPLTVQRSRIICDLTDACKAEAGDLIIPASSGAWAWDRIAGSLGDVVTGKVPGRTSRDEITLFKSVGLAVQDMAAAKAVYDEAVKRGIGTRFQF